MSQQQRARWARPNHIFFRHVGASTKDIYFRVNPQAIRVQQGGKSSVVDTLGGYFREVMYSEDPQHNGLMLPDLTIECETGAGYRKELQRLEWVFRNHGTPKSDGTPADTYFMDMADEDTLWFDGATGIDAAKDKAYGGKLPQGTTLATPPPVGVTQDMLKRITVLKKQYKTTAAKTMGGSRFTPRAFKLALLNFSWDESVQDPYRIRFNFRCKILRDLFWVVDGKNFRDGDTGGPVIDLGELGDGGVISQAAIAKAPLGDKGFVKTADFPLNPGAAVAMLSRTLQFLPGNIGGQVQPILNTVLQATGLGQNQTYNTIQSQGGSVYDPKNSQRLYWRGEFSGGPQVAQTQQSITTLLQALPESIKAPLTQTQIQIGGWQPANVDLLSQLVSALSLRNL